MASNSIYLKIAAVCVGLLLLEVWNLRRGRRIGRVYLGALQYDREASPKIFHIAFLVNVLWGVIVLAFLIFCCLKAIGMF